MPELPEALVWLILLVPAGSFLVVGVFLRRWPLASGWFTALAVGTSLVLSILTFWNVVDAEGHRLFFASHEWLQIGGFEVRVGLRVDGLTAVMLIVVTSVSFLVQVYSQGYMQGDPGYSRYFAIMCLFTTAMLGLVLVDSILLLFVFWELVGVCSYLLVGFWFQRPSAADAAKKAFIVTRFGDLGFLSAVVFIYVKAGTFDIQALQEMAQAGALSSTVITWIALGLFAGAAGKSAQFPLHVWLPDAMEGPTPVSALIHAATMVAAGVYLIARMFPLIEASQTALNVITALGAITALMAASMGLVMNDIKRVLAYSTISQLGYMMLALGIGAYPAAMFHLMNHAFFKAMLFLGSGSVNHATGTFDMRLMGGLRKAMPFTYLTFVIGSLSLAGVFPLAGFWSKDEILLDGWEHNQFAFWVALSAAFFTAFHVFRVIFMTFHGEYRGGAAPQHGGDGGHGGEHARAPHESPWIMVLPLVVLAIPAVASGFINSDGWMTGFLNSALPEDMHFEYEGVAIGIAVAGTSMALGGIVLAYLMYQSKVISAEGVGSTFAPVYTLLANKYYLDRLYEDVIVRRAFYGGVCRGLAWFDVTVVDGVVGGVGWTTKEIGDRMRRLPDGQLQGYGTGAVAVLVVMLGIYLVTNG